MKRLSSILKSLPPTKVIDAAIDYSAYVAFDMSITNKELASSEPETSEDFEAFISNFLQKNNAYVAYGGYIEGRNIYKRSVLFRKDLITERNVHIGIDLWVKAGTTVLAALDGKLHSFKNNDELGNYGPTIILEHEIETEKFYTLYGHLSLESIQNITVGKLYKKGEKIGTLGTSDENGDYAPHLHFQIIRNIENYWGDYPGVCSKNDLNFYIENCPDPNLLLKIT